MYVCICIHSMNACMYVCKGACVHMHVHNMYALTISVKYQDK